MEVEKLLASSEGKVVTTRPETTIADVARTLAEESVGAVVATDAEGKVAGIISERDIVQGLHKHGADLLAMRVGDVMSRSVVTCAPDSSVEDVMKLMTAHRIRHLPVVDDEALVGVISVLDVVKSRLEKVESDYDTLRTFMLTRIE